MHHLLFGMILLARRKDTAFQQMRVSAFNAAIIRLMYMMIWVSRRYTLNYTQQIFIFYFVTAGRLMWTIRILPVHG